MSDMPPMGELPAAGRSSLGSGLGNLPALGNSTEQIGSFRSALTGLKDALRDINSNSYMLTQGITSMFDRMTKSAKDATQAVSGVSNAIGGVSGGGGGGGRPQAPSGSSGGSGWVSAATASASAATAAAGGGYLSGTTPGYIGGGGGLVPAAGPSLEQAMIGWNQGDFTKDIAMFPLRFLREQINTNRQTALTSGAALGRLSYASRVGMGNMMTGLAQLPGAVEGTIPDLLSLFGNMPGYGAMYGFGTGNAPRTGGFLQGVREAQMINPGAPLAQIAGTIGGFASNTAAQQQSQMMTGGAFGMIKPGGGQKTLAQWAESVMKWLEGLRAGSNRGKPFSHGDLLTQYFPGSNIDAWFEVNGVPQDMREYWWSYALNKAQAVAGGASASGFQIGADQTNPMYQRLRATSAMTSSQFKLAGTMSDSYANREQANRWFNDLFGSFLSSVVPAAVTTGKLQFAQFMPDTMEQVMMTMMERSGKFGSAMGAYFGYGGGRFQGGGGLNNLNPFSDDFLWGTAGRPAGGSLDFWEGGDVGDIGDQYTTTGGTGTAGLHPDMKRKVGAMMQANPNLRVNSGLRDNRMQQTLKQRGVGRVSGKPSAHTRGMAADLGPPSQYNWLVANASKFGLKSGVGAGEPWHVGMGDLWSDLFGGVTSGFEALTNLNDPTATMGGVADVTQAFLQLLQGVMTGGQVDTNKLKFMPGIYDTLFAASKDIRLNGIISTTTTTGGGGGGGGPSVPVPGGGGSLAAATALFNAGFKTRDELTKIVGISKRESGWDPSQINPNGEDMGLMQVNVKAHRARIQSLGYSPTAADMLDIQKNANVAYDIYRDSGNYMAWNFSEQSMQWGPPPRPGWAPANNPYPSSPFMRTDQNEAAQIVASSGLPVTGDADYPYQYTMPQSSQRSGGGIQFHNTFQISGNGGGGGGIDVRRTVTMIADHLEEEMKRRMSRSN